MSYKIITDLDRCQEWVKGNYGGYVKDLVVTIGLEKDGNIVAVTAYNNFKNNSCHVHCYIEHGKIVTREYLWFVFYYIFEQAHIDVVISIADKNDIKSLKLVKHLGFKFNSEIKDANLMINTLVKHNCKWLKYGKF